MTLIQKEPKAPFPAQHQDNPGLQFKLVLKPAE
jgi:hypothetical protein